LPKHLLRPLALAGILTFAACGGAETVTTERTVT
jgi:hypothetical protein